MYLSGGRGLPLGTENNYVALDRLYQTTRVATTNTYRNVEQLPASLGERLWDKHSRLSRSAVVASSEGGVQRAPKGMQLAKSSFEASKVQWRGGQVSKLVLGRSTCAAIDHSGQVVLEHLFGILDATDLQRSLASVRESWLTALIPDIRMQSGNAAMPSRTHRVV